MAFGALLKEWIQELTSILNFVGIDLIWYLKSADFLDRYVVFANRWELPTVKSRALSKVQGGM